MKKNIKRKKKSLPGVRFYRLDKLLGERRPIETVIEGLILKRSTAALIGPTAVTKTSIGFHMAVSVATGKPFMGLKVKQGPAFVLLAESNVHAIRRVEAIAKDQKLSLKGCPLYLSNRGALLFDELTAKAVADEIAANCEKKGKPPQLIIIDPMSKSITPGDENSAADVGKFLNIIDRCFVRRFACAVVIVHHSGHKGGRPRGSSAFTPSLDTEIIVSRRKDLVTLRCTKQKDMAHFNPITLRIRVVELGKDADGNLDTSIVLGAAAGKATGKQHVAIGMLRVLEENYPKGVPTSVWAQHLIDEKVVSTRKAFSKLFDRLRKKGMVTKKGALSILK